MNKNEFNYWKIIQPQNGRNHFTYMNKYQNKKILKKLIYTQNIIYTRYFYLYKFSILDIYAIFYMLINYIDRNIY